MSVDVILDQNLEYGEDDQPVPLTHEFPDLTKHFQTEEVFDSKMEAAMWITEIGLTLNCVIVKSSSKIQNMVMQCERSRKFSDHRSKTYVPKTTAKRKRKTGTIKCNCPFKINSSSNKDGKWVVRVKCGFHNHSLSNALTGHSYPGRLNEEEMMLVEDLTKAGVNPRGILTLLKEKFPNNHSTMRTIYNARAKLNLIACQGRNVMQQFMVLSQERHYTVEYRYDEETNEVLDLFFSHPKFVKLAQCFHKFLILDCTFKTNRYKLPIFHMVSHTSTGATFTVAVAFLNREQEEKYSWALECVKRLYIENEIPSVFVTDREIALINAVEGVFPLGTHLLCTWHIGKAVLSQAQKHYKIKSDLEEKEEMTNNHKEDKSSVVKSKTNKEIIEEKQKKRQIMLDTFIDDWHSITWAQTRKDYEEACKKFILQWEPQYKGLVDYVTTTWLKPYKEKFVYAWTNEVKHFDNVATSRVESAHHKLKLYLGSSGGTFLSCWIKGHIKHENEFVGVMENFEKSATQTMHEHMEYPMLKEIRNFVSHKAISYLIDEFKLVEMVKNGFPCDHVKRKTLGIPCACELLAMKTSGDVIPLNSIDLFWRQLTCTPTVQNRSTQAFEDLPEIQALRDTWERAPDNERVKIRADLNPIVFPGTTNLLEPKVSDVQRGRMSNKQRMIELSNKRNPSEFEYTAANTAIKEKDIVQGKTNVTADAKTGNQINKDYLLQLPFKMQQYITATQEVPKDGSCGYHVVFKQLNMKTKHYDPIKELRDSMLKNIDAYEEMYLQMWGEKGVADLRTSVENPCPGDPKHWMMMPEAGFVVAETFATVVVLLAGEQSSTFVPTQTKPDQKNKKRLVCMAFINGNHFIGLKFKRNSPLPDTPKFAFWENIFTDYAAEWLEPYAARISNYRKIMGLQKEEAIKIAIDR